MSSDAAAPIGVLRTRLAQSRAALLRALEGVTEREFAAAFDGERSLVRVLAELAAAERTATRRVEGAAGPPSLPEKPLPPQVIHDLAGARYETERLLDRASGEAGATLAAAVAEIVDRESAVAARIAARPRT